MPTRLRIFHETDYQYDQPVVLGRHKVLVRPRDGHDLRIETSRLDISPAGIVSWHRDELDNSVALVTFDDSPVTRLTITSEVTVAHYLSDRAELPLLDRVREYPFDYEYHEGQLLNACLCLDDEADAFYDWINDVRGSEKSTIDLLLSLSNTIYERHEYQARDEEGVQSAGETLQLARGSCRDYAWLFVVAARHLGLAARFVSGYFHTEGTALFDGATHAWAEVYLPGAGWTGIDPTSNQITAQNHVPVAVAVNPVDIPPVSGRFTGAAGVVPVMTVRVNVNLC